MEKRKYFLQEIFFGLRKLRLSAHLQSKLFFNPADYFVERYMLSYQNAHNNRTNGMSPQVKIFFHGGTRMAKKKAKKKTKKKVAKKKATKKKAKKKAKKKR